MPWRMQTGTGAARTRNLMQHPARASLVPLIIGGPLLAVNRGLLAAGLRKRVDGWRRASGLLLRGEESSFVLSAFGLDPWSGWTRPTMPTLAETEARVAARLNAFFAGEPSCCVRLRRSRGEDRAEPSSKGEGCWTIAHGRWVDGPGRFVMPRGEEWKAPWRGGSDTGISPLLNVLCRVDPRGRDGCDVWVRINHAGSDGVPMQEVMTRLEGAWGAAAPVAFPTPEAFTPFEGARRANGPTDLVEVQFFADFSALLAWRKRENERLGASMTLAAALLWRMAELPEFREERFGSTVEVGAAGGLDRGVGVVVVRPLDYAERGGLSGYVSEFNRQVELNRRRASDGCRTLDAVALMPAGLARGVLRAAVSRTTRAFGSLVVTVVKDAKVFGAPVGEVGHPKGFIAIGGVRLPTADGRMVGSVTVKGARIA